MSYSTLLRRLKEYGLQRRHLIGPRFEDAFQRFQTRTRELVNGPGSSMGYRAIWHCLKWRVLIFPAELLSKTYIKKLTLRGQSFEGNTILKDEC